jgi:thiol-disulfide isomerase/thioredoxin
VRAAVVLALVVGCGEESPGAGPIKGRSDAVVTSAKPSAKAAVVPASASAPPKERPKPCAAAPGADGKKLSDEAISHLEAQNAKSVGDRVETGGGKWTWVNLWAAWCGPCKEEMPLLRAWEKKLAASPTPIRLAFVSLDDDERQAKRFMDQQPADGVRASHWLAEGDERKTWLEAVMLPPLPQLPVQILIDPAGSIRCVVSGSIEEQDFPAIQAFLAAKR